MTGAHCYRAHGLILSSELALPELLPASDVTDRQQPVCLTAGCHRQWPTLELSPHSTSTLQLAPGEWRLELEGIGWFRASAGQRLEWERWDDSVSDRDLRTFLVTSGLGALAIQRGAMVLQGTAVVRHGQAVLLLGEATSGKSTLAWCLLQQGWRLLSSELVSVDAQGRVWPGMQQLKLWHDATVALELDGSQLPLVRRGLKRYAVPAEGLACADQPAPLRCVYRLLRDQETDAGDHPASPRLIQASAALTKQAALLTVRNQAFQARVVRGMGAEQGLFLQASALVRQVPLHCLRVPDGIREMREAVSRIDLLDPDSMVPRHPQGGPEEDRIDG